MLQNIYVYNTTKKPEGLSRISSFKRARPHTDDKLISVNLFLVVRKFYKIEFGLFLILQFPPGRLWTTDYSTAGGP
jgi:hypothetical protein